MITTGHQHSLFKQTAGITTISNKEDFTWNEETSYHVGGVSRHLCLTTSGLLTLHLKTPGNSKVTHWLSYSSLTLTAPPTLPTNIHLQVAHSWKLILTCWAETVYGRNARSLKKENWVKHVFRGADGLHVHPHIIFLHCLTNRTLEKYQNKYINHSLFIKCVYN